MLLTPELRFLRTTGICPLTTFEFSEALAKMGIDYKFSVVFTSNYIVARICNIITLAPSTYSSSQDIPCEPFCEPPLACPHLSAILGEQSTQLMLSLHPTHKGAHKPTEPIRPRTRSLRTFDPNGVAPRVLDRNTSEMNVSVMWKSPFRTPAYMVAFSPKVEKK